MKCSDYSLTQKLLMLVAVCVVATGFVFLLRVWGFDISEKLMGQIVGTFVIIAVVSGILIAISSNMKEAKKDDKDNFYN